MGQLTEGQALIELHYILTGLKVPFYDDINDSITT